MEWVGRLRANTATNQANPCRTAHLLLPSSSSSHPASHNHRSRQDISTDRWEEKDKGKDKVGGQDGEEGEGSGGGSRFQLEIDLELEDEGDGNGKRKVRLSGAEVEGRYAHRMIVLSLPLPFCTTSPLLPYLFNFVSCFLIILSS
jgi:hypothetical protein